MYHTVSALQPKLRFPIKTEKKNDKKNEAHSL